MSSLTKFSVEIMNSSCLLLLLQSPLGMRAGVLCCRCDDDDATAYTIRKELRGATKAEGLLYFYISFADSITRRPWRYDLYVFFSNLGKTDIDLLENGKKYSPRI